MRWEKGITMRQEKFESMFIRGRNTLVLYDFPFCTIFDEFVAGLHKCPYHLAGELIVCEHFVNVLGLVNSKCSLSSIPGDSHPKKPTTWPGRAAPE